MEFKGLPNFEHLRIPSVGLLLVNLGTPAAPTGKALKPYLREFLSDPRVIEYPRILWWLILNLFVLTSRPRRSASLYKQIWTPEGSPLLVISKRQREKLEKLLRERFGTPVYVELGMRYGNPSIASALDRLRERQIQKLLVLPLYPQYSATSTGSVFDAVFDQLKSWRWVPDLRMISSFHDNAGYIDALAATVSELWTKQGRAEKLLISFHGIPVRYFENGDPYFCHCQKTARLMIEKLGLTSEDYQITFQSQFGREEWLGPKTDKTLKALAESGVKRVDVICPGFSTDCLETLQENAIEHREIFLKAGGKELRYIPALNDRADFMQALVDLCEQTMNGWVQSRDNWAPEVAQGMAEATESYCKALKRAP